ncbi:MAG: thermosome subunit beta [Candidatus Ranarchaeia archaeon]
MSQNAQPIYILKEGTTQSRGRAAQRSNITAAMIIADAVKSTLGPRASDKMLVDQFGDITITSDGASILGDIDIEHPAAKIIVNVAKTQDDEAGDGTTSAAILAGTLLKEASDLLEKGIHPTVIVKGFAEAAEFAQKELEKIAHDISDDDGEILRQVVKTTLQSKVVSSYREYLANLVVEAVQQVLEEKDGTRKADIDWIKVLKKEGLGIEESELVKGIVIEKEVVHVGMPKIVKDAKIALINASLEIEKGEFDRKLNITSPDQIDAFMQQEEDELRRLAEKIAESGATVVFCQKGIDDVVQYFLAQKNIMAARRLKKSDMEKLAKATGAHVVNSVDALKPEVLGSAGVVEAKKIGEDDMIFVEQCVDPKAVTLIIRGGTEHIVNEAERSIHDALCVARNALEDQKVVPGGGATEVELAQRIRKFADTLKGREQLAAHAFAKALEVIPTTLADNAGHDPIDILTSLRARHESEGNAWYGLDIYSGEPTDTKKKGIIETLRVKSQMIKSGTEAAQLILRIDDVIAAKKSSPAPGGPGGAGGPEDME